MKCINLLLFCSAEQARLEQQTRVENQKKVEEAFENWKTQKDLEQQLAAQQASKSSVESVKSNS